MNGFASRIAGLPQYRSSGTVAMSECPVEESDATTWHGLPVHENTGKMPVPGVLQQADRGGKRRLVGLYTIRGWAVGLWMSV